MPLSFPEGNSPICSAWIAIRTPARLFGRRGQKAQKWSFEMELAAPGSESRVFNLRSDVR
jgi:hypothetical protein